ncbi:thioredoxin-disulfide reductase [Canibacter zhoujuaniae]|uniref:thioredoxin-disulfide reductase n=1 Tax=Canibacter zhoujuaniae TaxID=2708343 RepID=UPI00141FE6FC|nr:thioredoxin-disulfide reductase [Canibacter zhoujuaniae]
MTKHNVAIIGSGPAGLTAAIYTARAGLKPVLFASSVSPGGDLMNTTEVENFPGFPNGVQGPELMAQMQEQAEKFGTQVRYEDVDKLALDGETKVITTADGTAHEAATVIFATGSAYRKLGVPGEDKLSGHGVSWCATCDGFFFRDKVVAVVGGGDSAIEEATFLTRFASKVYLIHRRNELRASKTMQDRAFNDPKIEFVWNTEVVEAIGSEELKALNLRNLESGETSTLEVNGLFVAIGSDPRTHLIHNQLELTAEGTIAVQGRTSKTSIAGVFAAGDVIDPSYRQAITAAGSGCVAAIDVEHYLANLTDKAA